MKIPISNFGVGLGIGIGYSQPGVILLSSVAPVSPIEDKVVTDEQVDQNLKPPDGGIRHALGSTER